ncbi:mfs multidrug transporter [Moniliophthora roreri MCA 2997]|uniref:Mfs multidrug transporter n=1 Tax=Moniliophthora roreri (strain MCA 2997) TaxID=1381753 RepID=V2WQ62_MONRO|nr:mfs multidrug transporter [Moniliophthora roreri MCA 2997]
MESTSSESAASPITVSLEKSPRQPAASTRRGLRFWAIFTSLFLCIFLAALELTMVSTALPAIVADLKGDDFLWVGTAYALASTAFLPFSGGIAETFGRRPAMLISLGLFTLGCALCGAARNMGWLIASRVVLGLGGGALLSLSHIILSDLVSLQERGTYYAVLGLAFAIGSSIGPLVGGAVAGAGQWRWLFYLNLPICGITIVMVILCLRLPTPPGSIKSKLHKMDWIGNFLVISSTTSVVIGLTWGGVVYPWSSARVLIPLILGLCGLVFFGIYEALWAANPILPISILSNISSVSGYIQTFIVHVCFFCLCYYLPVYYQACQDTSVIRSGANILALTFTSGSFLVITGVSVTLTQRYRPQIWLGWVLCLVGVGVYSINSPSTEMSQAIGLTILPGIGIAAVVASLVFPVLAPLDVTQNAYALAFYTFVRMFAGIWGITIGGTVLQNELEKRLSQEAKQALSGATASNLFAIIPQIRFLDEPLKTELRFAFGGSLQVVWEVLTAILGLGFLASFLMPDVPIQNVRDEKWAMHDDDISSPSHSVKGEVV